MCIISASEASATPRQVSRIWCRLRTGSRQFGQKALSASTFD